LRWRLFDFGRVDAEVAQARGHKAEALAAYRASVLKATEDVEDALSDLRQQQARADTLAHQISELTTARNQSQQAFDGGVISLVEVRDADRELLVASDQLVQAKAGGGRLSRAGRRVESGDGEGGGEVGRGRTQVRGSRRAKARSSPRLALCRQPK